MRQIVIDAVCKKNGNNDIDKALLPKLPGSSYWLTIS